MSQEKLKTLPWSSFVVANLGLSGGILASILASDDKSMLFYLGHVFTSLGLNGMLVFIPRVLHRPRREFAVAKLKCALFCLRELMRWPPKGYMTLAGRTDDGEPGVVFAVESMTHWTDTLTNPPSHCVDVVVVRSFFPVEDNTRRTLTFTGVISVRE